MKISKGKKGRISSKIKYDLREHKRENIYSINFDIDRVKQGFEYIIQDNIAVESKRKNSNEYISFVLAPPPSYGYIEAVASENQKNIRIEKLKMKKKVVQLTYDFLLSNFSDCKSCFVVHENQSVVHSHVLLSPRNVFGETVRIENLSDLRKEYNRLLNIYFSDELRFLEERKEKNQVLESENDREVYETKNKKGKRLSFDELCRNIIKEKNVLISTGKENNSFENIKNSVESAIDYISQMRKEKYEKDVLVEELDFLSYSDSIDEAY
jgi:hypothetical protein